MMPSAFDPSHTESSQAPWFMRSLQKRNAHWNIADYPSNAFCHLRVPSSL